MNVYEILCTKFAAHVYYIGQCILYEDNELTIIMKIIDQKKYCVISDVRRGLQGSLLYTIFLPF